MGRRGDGIRQLRSGQWQVRVRRKGFPDVVRTTPSYRLAREIAAGVTAEIESGAYRDHRLAERTLTQWIGGYIEGTFPEGHVRRGREQTTSRALIEGLGEYALRALTPAVIERWRDQRAQQQRQRGHGTIADQTVIHEMRLLREVLMWARREGAPFPHGLPTEGVRRRPRRADGEKIKRAPYRFFDDELRRIRHARRRTPGQIDVLGAALIVAVETAMRRSEIGALLREHVHFDRGFCHLPRTKNGSARDVPLSKRAARVLRLLWREAGEPPAGPVWPDWSGDAITRAFVRARRRARATYEAECVARGATPDERLTRGVFHDLRHTACSRLRAFFDPLDLARITGHKSASMLMHYYQPTPEELIARRQKK